MDDQWILQVYAYAEDDAILAALEALEDDLGIHVWSMPEDLSLDEIPEDGALIVWSDKVDSLFANPPRHLRYITVSESMAQEVYFPKALSNEIKNIQDALITERQGV